MTKSCSRIPRLLLIITALPTFSLIAAERLVPSQHPTIQDAVDAAASGDTIRIAAGDYYDQATVLNKTLTIVGDPGAVLHAHNAMITVPWNQNVAIFAFDRASVTVSNLVFEGHHQGDTYPNSFMGIIFRSSSGRMENCTIRGFRSTVDSQVRAVNINNGLNHGIIDVSVVGCSFSDNSLSLVFFGSDSNPSLTTTRFLAQSNTFVGLGAEAPFNHFGLWVSFGAEGTISGNTFNDHIFNGIDNHARAIIANDGGFIQRGYYMPLRPLTFSNNTFSNNSVHMSLYMANTSKITNNVFSAQAGGAGGSALTASGANMVISDNNFADTPGAIWLFGSDELDGAVRKGPATGVKFTRNWFRNVTTPIHQGSDCTFTEEGTQTSDSRPEFLSYYRDPGGHLQFAIRSDHTQTLTIEASTDFREWHSVLGTVPSLPISELSYLPPTGQPHAFYRLRSAPNDPRGVVPPQDWLLGQLNSDGFVVLSVSFIGSTPEKIAEVRRTILNRLLAQGFVMADGGPCLDGDCADPSVDFYPFNGYNSLAAFYVTITNQSVLWALAQMPEVRAIGGTLSGTCCD